MTGVALAPATETEAASVIYTTKRTAAVMQIKDAAGTPQTPAPVGFGTAEAPNGVAVLDGTVYLAEGNGVRSFPLAGGGGTTIVPGTASLASTAIAADPEHGRIYIGTSYPELADDVIAVDPATGLVETYERGFAGVTGLGVDDEGTLLVADDPGLAAGNIDSVDQGRLYAVGHHELRRAAVSITAAPPLWSSPPPSPSLRVLRRTRRSSAAGTGRVDALRRLRRRAASPSRTSTRARTPSRSGRPRAGARRRRPARVRHRPHGAHREDHLPRRRVLARPRPRPDRHGAPTSSARPSPARWTAATPRRASPGRRCRGSRPARTS